ALRYIGHLDLHKMWESATRRAGIALAYSQGFHPQPKIQLASALPLGFSSRCEVADMWVEDEIIDDIQTRPSTLRQAQDGAAAAPPLRTWNKDELADFQTRLQAALPPGIIIQEITQVDERAPALQTQVMASEFDVTLLDEIDADALTRRLSAVLEADSIPRERRGKPYDLRPLIQSLTFSAAPTPSLHLQLTAREGATGRPEEVLAVLEIPLESTRIERTKLIFSA
ncbi:MAG: TIGR03936 family radical SAM-associated protein, partial [Anaerolineales bacterium]